MQHPPHLAKTRRHRLSTLSFLVALICLLGPLGAAATEPPALRIDDGRRIDLSFDRPVAAREAYQALADAYGVGVDFDPRLRSTTVQLELRQVTFHDALDAIAVAAGHLAVPRSADRFLVAEDTPQNRRTYEPQVIRTFPLRHTDPKEIVTLLRSLLAAKSVAVDGNLNAVVLRGTPGFLDKAERLIATHDRPAAEIAVDVLLLRTAGKESRAATPPSPGRIGGAELERLTSSRGAELLASIPLSILDRDTVTLRLDERIPGQPRESETEVSQVKIGLTVAGHAHGEHRGDGSGLSLAVSLESSGYDGVGHRLSHRELTSRILLQEGEAYIQRGLLRLGPSDGRGAGSGELALALVPRLIRPPSLSHTEQHAFWLGTENRLAPVDQTVADPAAGPLDDEKIRERLRARLREVDGAAVSKAAAEKP